MSAESEGHEHVGCTRDSYIVSRAADVLEVSVVRRMSEVDGGVC